MKHGQRRLVALIHWLCLVCPFQCKPHIDEWQYAIIERIANDVAGEIQHPNRDQNDGETSGLSQEDARRWLAFYNKELEQMKWHKSVIDYNAAADLDNKTLQNLSTEYSTIYVDWQKKQIAEGHKFDHVDLEPTLKRQLSLLTESAALHDAKDIRRMETLVQQLQELFDNGKLCKGGAASNCYHIPQLSDLMAESRNYDELLWAWKGWRDVTGPKARKIFPHVVNYLNKGARENGYKDMGEYWRVSDVDDKDFDIKANQIWAKIEPFYKELHAYVRWKLGQRYPGKISNDGPIPAHILGNMWAQNWQNIADILWPFPNVSVPDVTKQMVDENYTPVKMFQKAEEFYTSIGMFKMTENFWKYSKIKKPTNHKRQNCHGTAYDMNKPTHDDFRVMMCTEVNMEDFKTVHHEMGHVEYYMAYRNKPPLLRAGANAGFHEAVGDTIALSVTSPKHLHKIGLLPHYRGDLDKKTVINYLFRQALEKVTLLPFALAIETWRWAVFNGSVTENNYNKAWWNLRKEFQGLAPPVERSENDLDPLSKYHVAHIVPYIRYYISFIIQFQFHKTLCKISGQTGAIYNCDIYHSKKAGKKFKHMLSLGAELPWPEAMKQLGDETSDSVDPTALLEYFSPLEEWLRETNRQNNVYVGWT